MVNQHLNSRKHNAVSNYLNVCCVGEEFALFSVVGMTERILSEA